jgi:cytidyltransferase-like protein
MATKKKAASGQKKKKTMIAVSGGFDPIHIGHVRMFEQAKKFADELVVILNNDNWLKKKTGYAFMPEKERKEVIEGLRAVDGVVLTKHGPNPKDADEMSVSHMLREIRPDMFANGGDRNEKNAADPASSLYWDINTCREVGIDMIFNIGQGGKVQSSSWLLKGYFEKVNGNSKSETKSASSKKKAKAKSKKR